MRDRKFLRIVKRAMRGDQDAFYELVRARRRNILYVATSLMHDLRDGEDVAQEAMMLIRRDITKLKKPESFDVWMYRSVYNACMNAKKKMARTAKNIELDEAAIVLPEEREELLPEEFIHNEESRKALIKAINDLPEHYQMCVLLFYYQDMSYSEIAEVLDIKIQDVANNLNRAKKKLRCSLDSVNNIVNDKRPPTAKYGVAGASAIALALHSDAQATISDHMLDVFMQNTLDAPTDGSFLTTVVVGAQAFLASVMGKATVGIACAAVAAGVGTGVIASNIPVDSFENVTPQAIVQSVDNQDPSTPSKLLEETPLDSPDTPLIGNQSQRPITDNQNQPQSTAGGSSTASSAPTQNNNQTDSAAMADPEMMFMRQLLYRDYQYNVYKQDSLDTVERLIVIERIDNAGNKETASFKGTTATAIPQGSAIVEAYNSWR